MIRIHANAYAGAGRGPSWRWLALTVCVAFGCRDGTLSRRDVAHQVDSVAAALYEGIDGRGIPRYVTSVTLSTDDVTVLRRAYGIEDPHRLYVSDTSAEGILKYDTQRKRRPACIANSYRVGYVSVRRPEESWEQAERRVERTPPRVFAGAPRPESALLSDLDPDVQPVAARLLRDARAAGFAVVVTATYRSPLREAFLMAEGKGRTHTLTSNHSYGHALDIVVDGGNGAHERTQRDWIAFRQWVTRYRTVNGESPRILGRVDQTWDWPHVDLPAPPIGFRTIEQAVERGRACLAVAATMPCNFVPHLAPYLAHALVR